MRKALIPAAAAVLLLLTGCGSPAPEEPTGVDLCIQDYLDLNEGSDRAEAIMACGDALQDDPEKFLEVYGE